MKLELTDSIVAALPTPEKGETVRYDSLQRGLWVRVLPSGTRSFVQTYYAAGKKHRVVLGTYPQLKVKRARAMGEELKGDVKFAGANPIEEARLAREEEKAAVSMDALCDSYLAGRTERASYYDENNYINHDIRPALGKKKAKDVTAADVQALHTKITARGAKRKANMVMDTIDRMFRTIKLPSPAEVVARNAEVSRERVLIDLMSEEPDWSELVAVAKAAKAMPYPFGPIVVLLLLTGQRKAEVAGMRWPEVDLSKRRWIVPAERSKNRKLHLVPLSDEAIAVLKALQRNPETDLIFSTTGETVVSGFGKAKRTLDALAGIQPWKLHDLRRSFATGLAELEVSESVIEALLNHVVTGGGRMSSVARVYNRSRHERRKREAVEIWGRHVTRLLEPQSATVIPMHKSRA